MRFTAVYILAQFRILQCWSVQTLLSFQFSQTQTSRRHFHQIRTPFRPFRLPRRSKPISQISPAVQFRHITYLGTISTLSEICCQFTRLTFTSLSCYFDRIHLSHSSVLHWPGVYINVWSEKVWWTHFLGALYCIPHPHEFVNELMMVIDDLINLIILIIILLTWSDNSLDWFS